MSTRTKQRIILVALAALVLWPAVHHGLARRVGFDPWEFFGWSMYATPLPRVQVALEARVRGETRFLRPAGEELEEMKRYGRLRSVLGAWAPTEAYARKVLDADPDRASVTVKLRLWHLEKSTARLNYRDAESTFER